MAAANVIDAVSYGARDVAVFSEFLQRAFALLPATDVDMATACGSRRGPESRPALLLRTALGNAPLGPRGLVGYPSGELSTLGLTTELGTNEVGTADTAIEAPSVDLDPLREGTLDHMAISVLPGADFVSDLARLGFSLSREIPLRHPAGDTTLKTFRHPHQSFFVVIGEAPGSPAHPFRLQIAQRGGPGVHHLAVRCRQLETSLERAIAHGGTQLGPIQTSDGLRQVFVETSFDSCVFELIERTGELGLTRQNTEGLLESESRQRR